MRTGVYSITCLPTGKRYIGSASVSFADRWKTHRHLLRKGTHHSPYLQNAWNKYGEAAFAFEVICTCPPEDCISMEQAEIDVARPQLNACLVAGSRKGHRASEETRSRMRAAATEMFARPGVKERLSAAQRKAWADPEIRAKRSEAQRLAQNLPEAKARRSELSKLAVGRPGAREKIGEATRVALAAPDVRAKLSESGKRSAAQMWADPEFLTARQDPAYRERVGAAQKAAQRCPDVRVKKSEAMKAAWADPVKRAAMLSNRTGRKVDGA